MPDTPTQTSSKVIDRGDSHMASPHHPGLDYGTLESSVYELLGHWPRKDLENSTGKESAGPEQGRMPQRLLAGTVPLLLSRGTLKVTHDVGGPEISSATREINGRLWPLKPYQTLARTPGSLHPLSHIWQLQELQNTGAHLSEPQLPRPLLFLS